MSGGNKMRIFIIMLLLLFSYFPSLTASDKPQLPGPRPFTPPDEKDLPNDEFGKLVRRGLEVFTRTDQAASAYVGNSLRCVNCHLDRGRLANSAPLWAAYPMYPAFRKKTGKVDTIEERIQGCFMYSMNGKAPPVDSEIMKSLVTYHYWLAKRAPTGVELPGRGYPELPKPARAPSHEAGEKLYAQHCAICHGADGQGQMAEGELVFPPLWGSRSYNWGAGMHRINTAASFIKYNMPLGKGHSLTDQEAWDLAAFVNSHERPQDPRHKGNIQRTDQQFHDENCLYGEHVRGSVLGSKASRGAK
jgi:thiosulfate dehydrogenase